MTRLLLVTLFLACGPTAAQIKEANEATYGAPIEDVFTAAQQETAREYPLGDSLPDEHVFATQPVWFTDHGRKTRGSDAEQQKAGNMQVSFAVLVVPGDAGVKITITPSAVDYTPNKADPAHLDDAAVPAWVKQRVDKLRVAVHRRLRSLSAGRGGAAAGAGTHD